jgi:actin-related protein
LCYPRFLSPLRSLFRPELLQDQTNIPDNGPLLGHPQLLQKSVSQCDVELRKELIANVIVCGGGSQMNGYVDRLQKEIALLSSQPKLRVIAANSAFERSFSVWIGASILGSLGSFQQMWMAKEEYAEYGRSLVEKKCP